MKKFLLYVFLMGWVLALAPLVCLAAPQVPEAGLRAEMAHRWDEAIAVYRAVLAKEPGRTDLWLRLADIQSRLGRRREVVDSLLQAVKSSPKDPSLYFRLSQADAVNNQPEKALADINWALRLDPGNVEYLRARAKLADWAGNTQLARKSYEELQRLEPGNTDVMLGRARTLSWSGALDRSAGVYREYLEKHPENAEAWLEFSRVQLWRGNYPAALKALGKYRSRFGETPDYRKQKARILAGAGRASRAMKLQFAPAEGLPRGLRAERHPHPGVTYRPQAGAGSGKLGGPGEAEAGGQGDRRTSKSWLRPRCAQTSTSTPISTAIRINVRIFRSELSGGMGRFSGYAPLGRHPV